MIPPGGCRPGPTSVTARVTVRTQVERYPPGGAAAPARPRPPARASPAFEPGVRILPRRSERCSALSAIAKPADLVGLREQVLGDVGQGQPISSGVTADELERLVDAHSEGAGDGALGLLDDDPAVERCLELLVDHLRAGDRLLLDEGDRGQV